MVLDSRFGLVYHPFGLVYPGNQNFTYHDRHQPRRSALCFLPGTTSSDGYAVLPLAQAGSPAPTHWVRSKRFLPRRSAVTHSASVEGNLTRYNVQNPQSGFGNTSGPSTESEFDRL